jgi:hypothetical protein
VTDKIQDFSEFLKSHDLSDEFFTEKAKDLEKPCMCDNCGHVTEEANLKPLAQVHHLASRLDAGAETPAGECRECQAFSYLLSTHQYPWSENVSLWLSNALTLTRGKKGKGLNVSPEYAKILYADIWKVEATLVDAGIIGKPWWHEAE